MSSSVGMMTFPTEWKIIKFMFQTTNQEGYAPALRHRADDHVELVGDGEMLGINGREPHL